MVSLPWFQYLELEPQYHNSGDRESLHIDRYRYKKKGKFYGNISVQHGSKKSS